MKRDWKKALGELKDAGVETMVTVDIADVDSLQAFADYAQTSPLLGRW